MIDILRFIEGAVSPGGTVRDVRFGADPSTQYLQRRALLFEFAVTGVKPGTFGVHVIAGEGFQGALELGQPGGFEGVAKTHTFSVQGLHAGQRLALQIDVMLNQRRLKACKVGLHVGGHIVESIVLRPLLG